MKRKIIHIDEKLCDGCGDCITSCSEGALKLVDGVAKLVKEDFCDGFGDCVGNCPTGALVVEEREAPAFDLDATREHVMRTQGRDAVDRLEMAQKVHEPGPQGGCPGSRAQVLPGPMASSAPLEMAQQVHEPGPQGGCPGSRAQVLPGPMASSAPPAGDVAAQPTELRQWPVQIHLVPTEAPYFQNKELVVMSTCTPLAMPEVHQRYLRGRSVVVGCPKLDDTRQYAFKLGAILREATIPKVIVPRMEVPCCGGLTQIVEDAVRASGRDDLVLQEDVIGLDGTLRGSRTA